MLTISDAVGRPSATASAAASQRRGAQLGPEAGVGQDVLQRLERTDGPTERGAGLGVVDGDLDQPAHRADRLGERAARRRHRAERPRSGCAPPAVPSTASAATSTRVEAHVDEAAGEVEPAERDDARRPAASAGDDELRDARRPPSAAVTRNTPAAAPSEHEPRSARRARNPPLDADARTAPASGIPPRSLIAHDAVRSADGEAGR